MRGMKRKIASGAKKIEKNSSHVNQLTILARIQKHSGHFFLVCVLHIAQEYHLMGVAQVGGLANALSQLPLQRLLRAKNK